MEREGFEMSRGDPDGVPCRIRAGMRLQPQLCACYTGVVLWRKRADPTSSFSETMH